MDDVKVSAMTVALPTGSDDAATTTRSEGLSVERSDGGGALLYTTADGTRINYATVSRRGEDNRLYIELHGLDESQVIFARDPDSPTGAVVVTH